MCTHLLENCPTKTIFTERKPTNCRWLKVLVQLQVVRSFSLDNSLKTARSSTHRLVEYKGLCSFQATTGTVYE